MTDRKTLKLNAREAMRQTKPHPFWVTLAVSGILAVLMGLALYISGAFDAYGEMFRQLVRGELLPDFLPGVGIETSSRGGSGFGSLLVLALELMASVLGVGYALYCLRVARHIPASVGDVFDVFGVFLRALLVRVLKSALVLLWGVVFAVALSFLTTFVLLLASSAGSPEEILAALNSPWLMAALAAGAYIPMIFASYLYRLAEFFMLDEPGMGALQSLSMSRMAMRGRKWRLLRLDLSFIGWYILSAIPLVAVWVQPYTTITTALFYNETAPIFKRELEQKLRERREAAQRPFDPKGYHVPGYRPQEKDDGDNNG